MKISGTSGMESFLDKDFKFKTCYLLFPPKTLLKWKSRTFVKASIHKDKENVTGCKSNETLESEKQMNKAVLTVYLKNQRSVLKVGST